MFIRAFALDGDTQGPAMCCKTLLVGLLPHVHRQDKQEDEMLVTAGAVPHDGLYRVVYALVMPYVDFGVSSVVHQGEVLKDLGDFRCCSSCSWSNCCFTTTSNASVNGKYHQSQRAIHNLTQKNGPGRIGVSRQTINSIEANRYVPSTVLALKLSEVFGIPVNAFFLDGQRSVIGCATGVGRRGPASHPPKLGDPHRYSAVRQGCFLQGGIGYGFSAVTRTRQLEVQSTTHPRTASEVQTPSVTGSTNRPTPR